MQIDLLGVFVDKFAFDRMNMIMNKERQQRFISMSKVSQKLLSHSVFSSIKKYLMSYPLVNRIYLKAIFSFYARLLISISFLTRKKKLLFASS